MNIDFSGFDNLNLPGQRCFHARSGRPRTRWRRPQILVIAELWLRLLLPKPGRPMTACSGTTSNSRMALGLSGLLWPAAVPITVRRSYMQFTPPKQRFVAKCLNFSATTFTITTVLFRRLRWRLNPKCCVQLGFPSVL
jgi:hypothetical protein